MYSYADPIGTAGEQEAPIVDILSILSLSVLHRDKLHLL